MDKPKHQAHRGRGWAERPGHGHNLSQPVTPPAITLPLCKARVKPHSLTFSYKFLVLSFKIWRPFSPFQWQPCPFYRSSRVPRSENWPRLSVLAWKKRKNVHFVLVSLVILNTTLQRMVHKVLCGKSVPLSFSNLSPPLQWSQNHIPSPFWDGYSGWSAPMDQCWIYFIC